jgi:hypothetical protein
MDFGVRLTSVSAAAAALAPTMPSAYPMARFFEALDNTLAAGTGEQFSYTRRA